MDFSRQERIISPDLMNTAKCIVIGAGAGGGWVTLFLAKLGIANIEVYDYDTVEEANLASQIYRASDIGRSKVEALSDIIADSAETEISVVEAKVNKYTEFELTGNTIIFNLVDSIESRKEIYEKVKGLHVKIIDARMGAEAWEIQVVNCNNEEECKNYEGSFEGEFVDLPCGEKAIIYATVNEASEIVNIVKKIINNEPYPRFIERNLKFYSFLGNAIIENTKGGTENA